jgi:predicted RNA binding protein YcfA (HicA-like mRNA interferase family)
MIRFPVIPRPWQYEITERLIRGRFSESLRRVGYEMVRQTGSHIRLVTNDRGSHHVTVPNHNSIKIGTLAGILSDVADHLEISRDELLQRLFGP